MMIDLEERAPVAERRHESSAWPYVALVLVALAAALVLARTPAHVLTRVQAHEPVHITMALLGEGTTTYRWVGMRNGEQRFAAPVGDYVEPIAAMVTIVATEHGTAQCVIAVDGAVMDQQAAGAGQAATCIWYAPVAGAR